MRFGKGLQERSDWVSVEELHKIADEMHRLFENVLRLSVYVLEH